MWLLGFGLFALVLLVYFLAPPFSLSFSKHEHHSGWWYMRVGKDYSLHMGRVSLILHLPDVLAQFLELEGESSKAEAYAYECGFREGMQTQRAGDQARQQHLAMQWGYDPGDEEDDIDWDDDVIIFDDDPRNETRASGSE